MSFMSFVNFSQFNLGRYEFRNYLNTDIFEALKKPQANMKISA